MLYEPPKAQVKANGALSEIFNITRGTRQMSPSPCLSAVCLETLAETIRTNKVVKGIRGSDTEYNVNLFVDYLVLYIYQTH